MGYASRNKKARRGQARVTSDQQDPQLWDRYREYVQEHVQEFCVGCLARMLLQMRIKDGVSNLTAFEKWMLSANEQC